MTALPEGQQMLLYVVSPLLMETVKHVDSLLPENAAVIEHLMEVARQTVHAEFAAVQERDANAGEREFAMLSELVCNAA